MRISWCHASPNTLQFWSYLIGVCECREPHLPAGLSPDLYLLQGLSMNPHIDSFPSSQTQPPCTTWGLTRCLRKTWDTWGIFFLRPKSVVTVDFLSFLWLNKIWISFHDSSLSPSTSPLLPPPFPFLFLFFSVTLRKQCQCRHYVHVCILLCFLKPILGNHCFGRSFCSFVCLFPCHRDFSCLVVFIKSTLLARLVRQERLQIWGSVMRRSGIAKERHFCPKSTKILDYRIPLAKPSQHPLSCVMVFTRNPKSFFGPIWVREPPNNLKKKTGILSAFASSRSKVHS